MACVTQEQIDSCIKMQGKISGWLAQTDLDGMKPKASLSAASSGQRARVEPEERDSLARNNGAAAPWADPNSTEQDLRQYLAQQARYNRELEDAVLALQAKFEQERFRTQETESKLGFLMESTQSPLELPALVSDLENQVKLRDSVIACLQQEIAVMRINKDKDLKSQNAGGSLETHLSRAKARSEAIAEQYNQHYTQESYKLRQKMSTAGARNSFCTCRRWHRESCPGQRVRRKCSKVIVLTALLACFCSVPLCRAIRRRPPVHVRWSPAFSRPAHLNIYCLLELCETAVPAGHLRLPHGQRHDERLPQRRRHAHTQTDVARRAG